MSWFLVSFCNRIQDVKWTDISWCHSLYLFDFYVDSLINIELGCQHIGYVTVPGCCKSLGALSCSAEMFRSALSLETLWWALVAFIKSPLSVEPTHHHVVSSLVVEDGRVCKGVHRGSIVTARRRPLTITHEQWFRIVQLFLPSISGDCQYGHGQHNMIVLRFQRKI